MTEKTFSITLSQEEINALARGLSKTTDYKLTDAEIKSLLGVAVHSWMGTLLGPQRFRTMTELYVAWLRDVHMQHLTDEEPSEMRLFTRLGFPYGQAAYIARVLLMEQPLTTRQKSLCNLQVALNEAIDIVKKEKWNAEQMKIQRAKITVSRSSRKELDAILDVLTKSGKKLNPIKLEGWLGSYQVILIVAGDLQILANEVEKIIKLITTGG